MEKNIKITKLHQTESDINYWLTKSFEERIEAIEFLREQFIVFKNVSKRLQRVCRVINKA
jgi:hypothetical protein